MKKVFCAEINIRKKENLETVNHNVTISRGNGSNTGNVIDKIETNMVVCSLEGF